MTHPILQFWRFTSFAVVSVICATSIEAQSFTEILPDQDVGSPSRAPYITLLGIAATGKLVTDASIRPNGPVAQTVYEELRAYETPAGPAGEVVLSLKSNWDEAGRVVEEVQKERYLESDLVTRYEGTRLISKEATFPTGKRPKRWNYWTYDKNGKLIEFRRGSGDEIQKSQRELQI